VESGLERVNDQGDLVSMSPKLQHRPVSDVEFDKLVSDGLKKALTVPKTSAERISQFNKEMVTPESTSIRDGWEKDGKPFDLEGERAKEARAEADREHREAVARLRSGT
jgi:hypothetical protein